MTLGGAGGGGGRSSGCSPWFSVQLPATGWRAGWAGLCCLADPLDGALRRALIAGARCLSGWWYMQGGQSAAGGRQAGAPGSVGRACCRPCACTALLGVRAARGMPLTERAVGGRSVGSLVGGRVVDQHVDQGGRVGAWKGQRSARAGGRVWTYFARTHPSRRGGVVCKQVAWRPCGLLVAARRRSNPTLCRLPSRRRQPSPAPQLIRRVCAAPPAPARCFSLLACAARFPHRSA